jgi:UDP-hydrolysing UDP-N-acetyl-D-glucosamine 2-epimerase
VKTIGVVTTGRADFGIYRPLLKKILDDPELELHLIVSGMHLSPEFGLTVQEIEKEGFSIKEKIECLLSSDTPEGIAKSTGLGVLGFGQAFGRFQPDCLVVLGDRFEMFAAALAALPFKIPVAHIHGGEITEGAMDESLRHALTKLSHLHFVSTSEYARRVIQMGEEPWRVKVCGALSLDNLNTLDFLNKKELEQRFSISLKKPPLLVTYHPVTLEYEQTGWQTDQLLRALKASGLPVVFTLPNADTAGREIIKRLHQFIEGNKSAWLVPSLGTRGYFSLMRHALAMVGNSSSGLIEAPSFGLPVVNIGNRQKGRLRGKNVIDVGYRQKEILQGIHKALDPGFRRRLAGEKNPYGQGQAARLIHRKIKKTALNHRLVAKRFLNLESVRECGEPRRVSV